MSSGGSWADPRRLGFHVLTVLAVVVCVVAARWQWDRANRSEADAVPEGPVVALADLDPATCVQWHAGGHHGSVRRLRTRSSWSPGSATGRTGPGC